MWYIIAGIGLEKVVESRWKILEKSLNFPHTKLWPPDFSPSPTQR